MLATPPFSMLGNIPIDTFLKEYWQKKPCFIKQALPNYQAPFTPEELAGFALEDSIESRLILETPTKNSTFHSNWTLEHGPLDESRFETLPETHWTLLIQAVDQFIPELHELLHKFRFLPNWRLDDIMASYATDQGSVGPHFDYYDVFLVQASGKRRWKIGQECSANSDLQADIDLKLLTSFDTTAEYLAEPGDILYIPPNIAHWGVAQGDCMTFSVGFRAPSINDIILDLSQSLCESLGEDQRFKDQLTQAVSNPGLIPKAVTKQITEILATQLQQEDKISQWFGRYMTEAKRQSPDIYLEKEPASEQGEYKLNAKSRAAYTEGHGAAHAQLFLDGENYNCSLTLAQNLCAYKTINPADYESDDQQLIAIWLESDILN